MWFSWSDWDTNTMKQIIHQLIQAGQKSWKFHMFKSNMFNFNYYIKSEKQKQHNTELWHLPPVRDILQGFVYLWPCDVQQVCSVAPVFTERLGLEGTLVLLLTVCTCLRIHTRKCACLVTHVYPWRIITLTIFIVKNNNTLSF